ncbi:MAG: 16S rRNA (adenine(1518)-N(6)/adenine(1519)-N(6))-dimethyltransferase RsmA [Pseudomonadota bacterium]|nr:16S rRNA (adenine(1518)-N(6)/adenine(1519)-N(6))-dimethyltransferase RsmA [Pseudomonadota bacterium]
MLWLRRSRATNIKHVARKRFGQNFLHDQHVINRILTHFRPQQGQRIVEIGPGLGALTWPLLERIGDLHAIELDRDLVARFIADPRAKGRLHLHQADALIFDFSSLADSTHKLRIIGNLPYNISTPLLFHLLSFAPVIQDMMFMLQKEVVQRISAGPGGKNYGRLSVMLQAQCVVEKVLDVSPGSFNPPPKVDSAVVRLTPHAEPIVDIPNPENFAMLVKAAFTQRRKTLRNNLKGILTEDEIIETGVDPSVRAETLSLDDFAALAKQV